MTFNDLVDNVIKIARETPNHINCTVHDSIVRRDIKQVIKDFIFQYIEKI